MVFTTEATEDTEAATKEITPATATATATTTATTTETFAVSLHLVTVGNLRGLRRNATSVVQRSEGKGFPDTRSETLLSPASVSSVPSVVKIRLPFAVVAVVAVVVVAGVAGCGRPVPALQPMAFSHQRHMQANTKCMTCHPGAEDRALAQLPTLADCMDCHGKPRGEHPDEPRVRSYAERQQEIPWLRVDRLPGHVHFSHAAHVTLAKMKCEDCHQGILIATKPLVVPDLFHRMADCMACHRQRQASNQCQACHK
jgi:menaquinone reductase, multiheme cytochrome c subunit